MNTFVRTALVASAALVPISVGANAMVARDTDPFNEIPAGFATLIGGGGGAVAALAVAGVTALNPAWRGAAPYAAGIGVALAAATVTGIAALEHLGRND